MTLVLVVDVGRRPPRACSAVRATRACTSIGRSPTRTTLRAELERRLGATVTSLTVQHLDLVDDTTLVDVRYRLPRIAAATPVSHEALVEEQAR